MNKFIKLIFALFIFSSSCNDKITTIDFALDDLLKETLLATSDGVGNTYYILPQSDDLSTIPNDPKNKLTPEKVELGKLLFHETGFADFPQIPDFKNTYSCATCHLASKGFQAGIAQSIGDGGIGFGEKRVRNPHYEDQIIDVQTVRSPSAMNLAYQPNILWSGELGATYLNKDHPEYWNLFKPSWGNFKGYEGLETQAIAAINIHRMDVSEKNVISLGYKELFDKAFPDIEVKKRYNEETAGLAIGAYERTLLANQAPFQDWLKGSSKAMSDKEKQGAILFFSKGLCFRCHNGPILAKMEFHALGMNDIFQLPEVIYARPNHDGHLGRGGFTGVESDMNKFKVPQLYNLADSPFYGHGASFTKVRDVVSYKNKAIHQNKKVKKEKLSPMFHPLNLTEEEIDLISIFIEKSLYDPNLMRYQPEELPSGLCFPNGDSLSKITQGCDDYLK